MLNQLRKRTEGFTIIEVMIVLAIAGLILLIVFLAVPALQRNSRNTQRNSDAASVLGVVNEYINNNNGVLPGCVAGPSSNVVTISGGTQVNNSTPPSTCTTPTNATTANIGGQFSNVNFGSNAGVTVSSGTLYIITSAICNGNSPAASTSTRAFVATCLNEAGVSNTVQQCKQS